MFLKCKFSAGVSSIQNIGLNESSEVKTLFDLYYLAEKKKIFKISHVLQKSALMT